MNIIDAIHNLIHNPILDIVASYSGRNRANNAGDALEEYIKDLFSDSFKLNSTERLQCWNDTFSYLGNNSNPPDIIIKNGDAIEVKKIESNRGGIPLNSSHPKHTLKASSPLISTACRNCEDWIEKDIIYAIGTVVNNKLKRLFFVYGLDYCASEECYLRIKNRIKNSVECIEGIEFTPTKELGHVNKVDPLGVTYLRIRGMWGIEHPERVFHYILDNCSGNEFEFRCIINEEKWNTFNNTQLLNVKIPGFSVQDVQIKNPDNPVKLKNAKLISYII